MWTRCRIGGGLAAAIHCGCGIATEVPDVAEVSVAELFGCRLPARSIFTASCAGNARRAAGISPIELEKCSQLWPATAMAPSSRPVNWSLKGPSSFLRNSFNTLAL